MTAYQDWIDANTTMILEYKFQEASGNLIDSGTGGGTYDMTPTGTPQYQNRTASNFEGTGYAMQFDGGSTNDGAYMHTNAWANGLTSGSFIMVASRVTAGTDWIFTVANEAALGPDAVAFGYNTNEQLSFWGYDTVGLVRTHSGTILWPTDTNAASMFVIVFVHDGTDMGMWVNGYKIMGQQLSDTSTDDTVWFGDAYTAGSNQSTGICGFHRNNGGTPVLPTSEAGVYLEYIGVCADILTGAEIRTLTQKYHGGGIADATPTLVSGRNNRRHYWTNQSRGETPAGGMDLVQEIWSGGASVDNIVYYLNCGSTRRFNAHNDTINHGDPFSGSNRQDIGSSWRSPEVSPDGYWILGNDGRSTAPQELSFKWNPDGWWDNANIDDATNFSNITGGTDFSADSQWFAATRSAGAPDLWKYNSGTDNWDLVTSTKFTNPPLNKYINSAGQTVRFGRGSNTDLLALGGWTSGTDASGHYIYEYDSGADSWEKVTYTIQAPRSAYGVAVAPVRRHIFIGNNATTTVASGTGSMQVYMYKETSGGSPGTWTLDNNLWNNLTAHPDQGTGSTTPRCALFIDDDLYVGCSVSTGSKYTNFWHLRWNGTYYDAQASISHPGDDASYRRFFSDIKATSDGTILFTCSNNLGGPSGHPSMLAFDRNTSTGALTVRDTPFDFQTPQNIHNNNTTQQGSGLTTIAIRETIPTVAL